MGKQILIIGTGFGGLSTAIRLLARGHQVTLLESRDRAGGRAYPYKQEGFTFDGGPTVITAPFLFDELFQLAGEKRSDHVPFVPCDPFYRIFGADGETFDYNSDLEFTLNQIAAIEPGDREGYRQFLATTKPIFEKGFVDLADQPFLSFMDMVRVAPDLIQLKSHQSVYRYVSRFIRNEFLRQCFSFHPLLVGGNPFDTTSIYSMIHYLEREWGVHYAMGGTGALVDALVQLIESMGGTFRYEQEVRSIKIDRGQATGVQLASGEEVSADIVVSNGDVANTYRKLIREEHRPTWTNRKLSRMHYSMSLFVIYFGTDRLYRGQGLSHHNIILGRRYKELLADIFHKKKLAGDFSLYLHMPTITDPSLAPPGCESFYVLSPVPHLDSGTDWKDETPRYKEKILDFLEENYLPDLSAHIVTSHTIDPVHFRDTLHSYKGSAFSVEPRLTQSAWFRPHNRSEDISNLYFTGAGTHPGAGLPGVLSSAKIVERLIEER